MYILFQYVFETIRFKTLNLCIGDYLEVVTCTKVTEIKYFDK
jgi:hypothetical protein